MTFDLGAAERVLRERFSLDRLRDDQREVIAHLMTGGDAFTVWPTGSGKSLCFQLPALLFPPGDLTIVLSPLIALMQDQVEGLARRGIAAAFVNSSLSRREREDRLARIGAGEFALLYVTPERFRKPAFREALTSRRIRLLAVDEAHCVTEWGHDFRPEYGKVGAIRRLLGSPPAIALTATATEETASQVSRSLDLSSPLLSRRPVTRDNLGLRVTEVRDEEEQVERIVSFVRRHRGAGIVYCALIRDLERVRARIVRGLDDGSDRDGGSGKREVMVYHGELPPAQRARELRDFLASDRAVVVATNAFGMGVDKPDIRFIVHAQVPGSLEAYAQEIGRAGRDGIPSRCELLYLETDLLIQKQFVEWTNPDARFLRDLWNVLERWGDSLHARELDDLTAELLVKNRGDGRVGTALGLLESAGFLEGSFARKNLAIGTRPTDADLAALAPEGKRERDLRRLQGVVEFVRGVGCRRAALERYFDSAASPPPCGACDRCAPDLADEPVSNAAPDVAPRVESDAELADAPLCAGDWILVDGRHSVRIESVRRRGDRWFARGVSAGDFRTRDYDLSRIHWDRIRD